MSLSAVGAAVGVYMLVGLGCALTVTAVGRVVGLLDDITTDWTFWGALLLWPLMLYYIARPEEGLS